MLIIALTLALAPPAPECVVTTPVTLTFETDDAKNVVNAAALERVCFRLEKHAPFVINARLLVSEEGFSLALDAKDERGKAVGSVTREATAPGAGAPDVAIVNGAVKDALTVLRKKIGLGPATRSCRAQKDVVMLWHKGTSASDRMDAKRALSARCVTVKDEVEGNRKMATDLASMLDLPLLAIKSLKEEDGAVAVAADVVDPKTEELTVKAHASEKGQESDVVIRRALDAVLSAL